MVAIATALRPYPCLHPKCVKGFTKASDLKRHEKLHLPKEKLEAVYINFALLPILEIADSPGHKYRCKFPGCNHMSLQLSNLQTHMNKMHYNVKNKKCSDCNFETADSSELTRHRSGAHNYTPKKRLPRQKNISGNDTIDEEYCDEGEDEDKGEDIDMASLESPPSPRSTASSSGTCLGMELDSPPSDNHRVNVNLDIDMAVFPVPPPSPASTGSRHSMCYTPPLAATGLAPAPLYVASPPRNTDSDMLPPYSSSPPSHYRSMSYTPPPTKTRPTDRAYLPSPPRSPSPHTSATSLLGLPAELFITGPRDCRLPRIMSYAE